MKKVAFILLAIILLIIVFFVVSYFASEDKQAAINVFKTDTESFYASSQAFTGLCDSDIFTSLKNSIENARCTETNEGKSFQVIVEIAGVGVACKNAAKELDEKGNLKVGVMCMQMPKGAADILK